MIGIRRDLGDSLGAEVSLNSPRGAGGAELDSVRPRTYSYELACFVCGRFAGAEHAETCFQRGTVQPQDSWRMA